MGDFPFVNSDINCYSFITFKGDLYIFGKIYFNFYRLF